MRTHISTRSMFEETCEWAAVKPLTHTAACVVHVNQPASSSTWYIAASAACVTATQKKNATLFQCQLDFSLKLQHPIPLSQTRNISPLYAHPFYCPTTMLVIYAALRLSLFVAHLRVVPKVYQIRWTAT